MEVVWLDVREREGLERYASGFGPGHGMFVRPGTYVCADRRWRRQTSWSREIGGSSLHRQPLSTSLRIGYPSGTRLSRLSLCAAGIVFQWRRRGAQHIEVEARAHAHAWIVAMRLPRWDAQACIPICTLALARSDKQRGAARHCTPACRSVGPLTCLDRLGKFRYPISLSNRASRLGPRAGMAFSSTTRSARWLGKMVRSESGLRGAILRGDEGDEDGRKRQSALRHGHCAACSGGKMTDMIIRT